MSGSTRLSQWIDNGVSLITKLSRRLQLYNQSSLSSSITTDTSVIYPYDDGSQVHIMALKNNAATETQVELAEQGSITNLSTKGAGYLFTGASNIVIPHNSYIDPDIDDFVIIIQGYFCQSVVGTKYFIHKETGGVGWGIYQTDDDLYIRFDDGTTDVSGKIFDGAFAINKFYNIVVHFDRSGYAKVWVNGFYQSILDISSASLTIANASNMYFGSSVTPDNYLVGTIKGLHYFRGAINASDALDYSLGADIKAKHSTDSWTQVAAQLSSQTYIYSLIVFDGNLYGGTIPNGLLFRFDTDHWTQVAAQLSSQTRILSLAVFDGNLYGGTGSNGLLFRFDTDHWTQVAAQLSSQEYIYSLAVFDGNLYGGTYPKGLLFNYSKHCTAEYLPEGIGHYSWIDNSGNGLHGTVSGALPFGWNIGDTRVAYLSTTSTSPTMTDVQRGGWRVKSIVMETAQNLTEIDVTQETSAIELMSDKTLNNGKMVWSTLADHNVYAVGTDKDLVFKLTGNGGDGTKIYVTLEKVF